MKKVDVKIVLNGRNAERRIELRMLLSDFIRQEAGLAGTHVGCEHGVCGAYTILLDAGAVEGNTDFGVPGYYGPCPPVRRRHRYTFHLHAMDVMSLEVPSNATAALTGFFVYQHTIARASFTVLAGPRLG